MSESLSSRLAGRPEMESLGFLEIFQKFLGKEKGRDIKNVMS